MSNKKTVKLIFVMCFVTLFAKSQDVHFSQYAEIGSTINPALAGNLYDTRLMANYKTQWGSVGKSYQTYGINYEQTIGRKKLRPFYHVVIFNLYRDQAGDAKLSNLNPNIGYCINVKANKFLKASVGFQGGFNYKTIDLDNLKWDKQFNGYEYQASLPTGEPNTPRSSLTSYDMGAGFNLSYAKSEKFISARDGNKFNVGFSAYHFSVPLNSFIITSEKLSTRVCFYLNGDFNIPGSNQSVMPSFLYMQQGKSSEFVIGAMYKFILQDQSLFTNLKKPSAFALGGQYRYKDAVIPCILYQYDRYALGLSYDINVSSLTPASKRNGGLEVMLRYNMSLGYGRSLGRGDTKPSY